MAMPGHTFRSTMRAAGPTGGATTVWRVGAMTSRPSASAWPCGMGTTASSRNGPTGGWPTRRATTARTSRITGFFTPTTCPRTPMLHGLQVPAGRFPPLRRSAAHQSAAGGSRGRRVRTIRRTARTMASAALFRRRGGLRQGRPGGRLLPHHGDQSRAGRRADPRAATAVVSQHLVVGPRPGTAADHRLR